MLFKWDSWKENKQIVLQRNMNQFTFSLNASHFLLHRDCFEGKTTTSVLVLLSTFAEESVEESVYSRRFFLVGLPLNSSFTIS